MNTEAAEMAAQFAKYGDIVVGFVVVQGLGFAYGLGKQGDLKHAILRGYNKVMKILILSGLGYLTLVAVSGYWEHSLRKATGDSVSGTILAATVAAVIGRCVIILAATVICACALRWNKPS